MMFLSCGVEVEVGLFVLVVLGSWEAMGRWPAGKLHGCQAQFEVLGAGGMLPASAPRMAPRWAALPAPPSRYWRDHTAGLW